MTLSKFAARTCGRARSVGSLRTSSRTRGRMPLDRGLVVPVVKTDVDAIADDGTVLIALHERRRVLATHLTAVVEPHQRKAAVQLDYLSLDHI